VSESSTDRAVLAFRTPKKAVGWSLCFQKELMRLKWSPKVVAAYLRSLGHSKAVEDGEGRVIFDSALPAIGIHSAQAEHVTQAPCKPVRGRRC